MTRKNQKDPGTGFRPIEVEIPVDTGFTPIEFTPIPAEQVAPKPGPKTSRPRARTASTRTTTPSTGQKED